MASMRELLLQCFLYPTLINLLLPTPLVASASPMSLPGCLGNCGNITIPYPFGTSPECCRDGFNITCNYSTTPPKAFLGSGPATNIELIDINITGGEARVYKRFGYRCYNQVDHIYDRINTSFLGVIDLPYLFSNRRNKFTVIGCYTLAYIVAVGNTDNSYMSGCASFCEIQIMNSTTGEGVSCNGLGCCQTAIPTGISYYEVEWGYTENDAWFYNPCMYAVLVEEDSFKFRVEYLSGHDLFQNQEYVPVVLDWAIRDYGTSCQNGTEKNPNPACRSNHSSCYNTSNGEGYLCNCTQGYEGNPYHPNGCTGNVILLNSV